MEFLLIATAHFLALLSPGPDFFLILQTSLTLPRRSGIAVCAGIAAANGVYLLLAVLGLEAAKELAWLMVALRYLGSLYLIYLGIMLLKAPRQPFDGNGRPGLSRNRGSHGRFLLGFLSGILNPKNMIFYLSLFTAMVAVQTGLTTRCLYALWMVSMVFFWDCLVVFLVGRPYVKTRLGRGVFYVEKVSGTMLTLFGIALPFS